MEESMAVEKQNNPSQHREVFKCLGWENWLSTEPVFKYMVEEVLKLQWQGSEGGAVFFHGEDTRFPAKVYCFDKDIEYIQFFGQEASVRLYRTSSSLFSVWPYEDPLCHFENVFDDPFAPSADEILLFDTLYGDQNSLSRMVDEFSKGYSRLAGEFEKGKLVIWRPIK